MKHPNTFAAVVTYLVSVTTQWLVQRYAHASLSDYWQQTINGAAVAAVLYVGKAGLKNALLRVWAGPKRVWQGAAVAVASK